MLANIGVTILAYGVVVIVAGLVVPLLVPASVARSARLTVFESETTMTLVKDGILLEADYVNP